eukprot:c3049_g1_i1.p1 GENE.c3049_g1_i1~~c3049_g1_i1.p1  ORF type:complete len:121 (-),score=24.42 c3049_g1_i1:65-427(-)
MFLCCSICNFFVFFQTSQTWGPIRELHAHIAATRAIENGFTLFRCSSLGVSGVYGPFHQPFATVETLEHQSVTFTIPITEHVTTMYGTVGEWFGWICFALIAVCVCFVTFRMVFAVSKND